MGMGYKKYDTVMINGRNRILFVKTNSKSKNPILYIKYDKEYITYKSFLRKRKVKGGVDEIREDVTNANYDDVNKIQKEQILITKIDGTTITLDNVDAIMNMWKTYNNYPNNTNKDFKSFLKSIIKEKITKIELIKFIDLFPSLNINNIYIILVNNFDVYASTKTEVLLNIEGEIYQLYFKLQYLDVTNGIQYNTDINKSINGKRYKFYFSRSENPIKILCKITSNNITKSFIFDMQNNKIMLEHIEVPRPSEKGVFQTLKGCIGPLCSTSLKDIHGPT